MGGDPRRQADRGRKTGIKDRRAFDQRHAADHVVTSAIFSEHHPGMTEVVAVVGGNRRTDDDERRFLVPSDEYAGRGRSDSSSIPPSCPVSWAVFLHRLARSERWVMIDILAPKRAGQGNRRPLETLQHLNCLTRQIAARAGRRAITVKVRSRARRRSGFRHYRHDLADRLAFEHCLGTGHTLAIKLVVQEQIIDALEHAVKRLFPPVAGRWTSNGLCAGCICSSCGHDISQVAGLAMSSLVACI